MPGLVNALLRKRPTRAPCARNRREEVGRESLFHLVIGGIGESLPVGVFVVTGQVAGLDGGFVASLALLVAALAAFLTGLCFSEYKSLEHVQSSITSSFYRTSGEGISFLVGWFLIFHQSSTFVAFAKTLSSAVDYASGKNIHEFTSELFGSLPVSHESVDLVAVVFILFCLTTLVALGWNDGTRCFSYATCVFTASVSLFFIATGAFYANYENWFPIDKSLSQVFNRVLNGAALCSCVYSNHYLIDARGRSLWKSCSSLPVAFGICVFFCLLACVGVALIISLMVHYRVLSSGFALMEVFEVRDVNWARYAMAVVTVLCVSVAVLNACQSLCDTVQVMADDGLLFRCLSDGRRRGWTCVRAALFTCPLAALLALLSPVSILLQMMSAGYLIVNAIVCVCVLLRRYRLDGENWNYQPMASSEDGSTEEKPCSDESSSNSKFANNNNVNSTSHPSDDDSSDTDVDAVVEEYKEKLRVATLTHLADGGLSSPREPNPSSERYATACCVGLCVVSLPLSSLLTSGDSALRVVATVLLILLIFFVAVMSRQPQVTVIHRILYRVPLVPWTPSIALCLHLSFLVHLLKNIWPLVCVWSVAGSIIYFSYSMHHSSANVVFVEHASSQEQIQLRPLPRTSVVSSLVPSHRDNKDNERRLTRVDTILISA